MAVPFPIRAIALAVAVVVVLSCSNVATLNAEQVVAPCPAEAPCTVSASAANDPPSWIFHRGTYTHDPYTGARVAQYQRIPPVEPLDDPRLVTSRYRRSRTTLRGANGSIDTYYEVQAWGNGRGGIDAEWERFHDAWKESYLQGGYYYSPGGGGWGGGWGGYPGPYGYGGGYGYGLPGGVPFYGYPGYGGPGYGVPWSGGAYQGYQGGPPQGGGQPPGDGDGS